MLTSTHRTWQHRLPQFQVAYNLHHLQLQNRIECTFGIFIHRWSILRSAIQINCEYLKDSQDEEWKIQKMSNQKYIVWCRIWCMLSGKFNGQMFHDFKKRSYLGLPMPASCWSVVHQRPPCTQQGKETHYLTTNDKQHPIRMLAKAKRKNYKFLWLYTHVSMGAQWWLHHWMSM